MGWLKFHRPCLWWLLLWWLLLVVVVVWVPELLLRWLEGWLLELLLLWLLWLPWLQWWLLLLLLSSHVSILTDEAQAVKLKVVPQVVWDVLQLDAQGALENSPPVIGYLILLHFGKHGCQGSCGLVQLALLHLVGLAELDWRHSLLRRQLGEGGFIQELWLAGS